jgi:hypothetical protein
MEIPGHQSRRIVLPIKEFISQSPFKKGALANKFPSSSPNYSKIFNKYFL